MLASSDLHHVVEDESTSALLSSFVLSLAFSGALAAYHGMQYELIFPYVTLNMS